MLAERRQADELMDDPALPAADYRAVLGDLAQVNRLTLAYRPTLDFLDRAVGNRPSFSLLDVGFGQGDMLRQIARWAQRRGKTARLVGIDLNERSLPAANALPWDGPPIDYRHGDYNAFAGAGFDCIVSSLVAHHMTERQLHDFLRFMDGEAQAGWFVNDLHRHGAAYMLWPVLAAAMRWHPIVRADGHTSIARSFRAAEWRRMLATANIEGARIARRFPCRLCVERLR